MGSRTEPGVQNIDATEHPHDEAREIVVCQHCLLTQFKTANNLCRKCNTSLDAPKTTPSFQPPPVAIAPVDCAIGIGMAIRLLRIMHHMSQKSLSKAMGCPRTWVSKVENGTMPTMSSIRRFSDALGIPTRSIVELACLNEEVARNFIATERFIGIVTHKAGALTDEQRNKLLDLIKKLANAHDPVIN
jgi:transcriptional regulator with XRE-family HTH domain